MRTVCPQGHHSANSDFCDVCGTRIRSLPDWDGVAGKHHASGRLAAGDGQTCPRCGATLAGQFCEACGFRVSARSPFAPVGRPAEPPETSPSGRVSSGPPESLFPPISKPEPPFSGWSRPEPLPSPPAPPTPALQPASSPSPVRQVESRPDPAIPVATPKYPAPPTAPIPSLTGVTWTVLVASDRVYYDRTQAGRGPGSAVEVPAPTSERGIRLGGK